jgi:hypothetical protein
MLLVAVGKRGKAGQARTPAIAPTMTRRIGIFIFDILYVLVGRGSGAEAASTNAPRGRPASGRTDRRSRRFWRRQNTEAFRLGIAAGKPHSKRHGLDFGRHRRRRLPATS